MANDLPLEDDLARKVFQLCQEATERHVARCNGKPRNAAYHESAAQAQREIDEIMAKYPGVLGRMSP